MIWSFLRDRYRGGMTHNHFPVFLQLGVLTLGMFVLFGLLWLQSGVRVGVVELPEAITNIAPSQAATAVTAVDLQLSSVDVTATAAFVYDVQADRVLYTKNADQSLPLASITKLMTALLAHELLADETNIKLPATAIKQEGNSGLREGEVLTAGDLIEFALLSSSNDAAYTLSDSVGELLGVQDANAQFVASMNIRADDLGLSSLEFFNMTGLDISETRPGAVGSARDVSFLLQYIVENYPDILQVTKSDKTRIYNASGVRHDVHNTNPVIDHIPSLLASKTGYTNLAGGNLTVAFDIGHNRPIVVTVLGSTRDARFSDVLTLVEAVEASVLTQTQSYE